MHVADICLVTRPGGFTAVKRAPGEALKRKVGPGAGPNVSASDRKLRMPTVFHHIISCYQVPGVHRRIVVIACKHLP